MINIKYEVYIAENKIGKGKPLYLIQDSTITTAIAIMY